MSERPESDYEPAADLPSPTLGSSALAHGDCARAAAQQTDRDILSLTWPVVLSQLIANGVNLVDIFMLGRLGTQTLAAIGYATQFLFLVQACLMAVGAACVAMMARAIGAGQAAHARRAFAANLLLGVGVALVLSAVCVSVPHWLLELLAVPAPVVDLAVPYFRLTLTASVPLALALVYEHAFRAARDTVLPLKAAAAVAATKLGLNAVLIFGLFDFARLELIGAGLATVASQVVGFGVFFWASRRSAHESLRLGLADLRRGLSQVRQATALAVPAIGERIVMTLAMMTYFRFLGQYGVAAVAAYNVGIRILSFTWVPGLGLSVAASTLVGQALGRHDPTQARSAAWRATRMGLFLSITLAALFIWFRVPLARAFTSDDEVIAALDPFILMLGAGLPLLVSHFTLAGALRGAGDTISPLLAAAAGSWLGRVPLGFIAAQLLKLPLPWVWSIMIVDHLIRCTFLTLRFRRGAWQRVGLTPQHAAAAE